MNTAFHVTQDLINSLKTGISAATDSNSQRTRPFSNSLKADPIQANTPEDTLHKLNESRIYKSSPIVGETIRDEKRANPNLMLESDRVKQLSNREPFQKSSELGGLEPTRPISRSANRCQQQPHSSENIQLSAVGLKFSHSRLEGTDLAIDVALIASGMGTVLIMEHLIDMALHTSLKKEHTRNHKQTGDLSKNSSTLNSDPNKSTVDHAMKNGIINTSSPAVIAKEITPETNTQETRISFKR